MELVVLLRELWHRRVIVAVIALFAVLAGLAIAFKLPSFESRAYSVGVASARILVDTPKSQVVEVSPKGSEMLGVRANLIANLMAEGDMKSAIAQRAGIARDDLVGIAESADAPPGSTAVPRDAYALTTRVLESAPGAHLPIIEIETQAPDADGAGRLAEAAVEGLRAFLDSKAATEQVPDAERLRVSGLGTAQASDVSRGDRRYLAVAATLLLLLGGCAVIVLVGSFVRGWRLAAQWEREDEPPAEDEWVYLTPLDWTLDDLLDGGSDGGSDRDADRDATATVTDITATAPQGGKRRSGRRA